MTREEAYERVTGQAAHRKSKSRSSVSLNTPPNKGMDWSRAGMVRMIL